MKSIYFKNFLATAVMVLVSFLMIGVAFLFIGQSFVIKSHKDSMEQNAKAVTKYLVSMSSSRYFDDVMLRVTLNVSETLSGNQVLLTNTDGLVFSCSEEIGRCQHIGSYVPEYYINALQRLGSLLDTSVLTVTGRTLRENLDAYVFEYPENPAVIRTVEEPFSRTGGVAVLHGNLCPNTGVSKPGAIDPSMHRFVGRAKCFNSEEEAEAAILGGRIQAGDVVVIRYEGPKGGPGMREMFKAMKYLYGMGLAKSTALITDGRFSGTNNGCFVGHISPEAAEGGPLAIVEDGDEILIDVDEGRLEMHVSDAEIAERYKSLKMPEKQIPNGYLRLYAKTAASADQGAVIKM